MFHEPLDGGGGGGEKGEDGDPLFGPLLPESGVIAFGPLLPESRRIVAFGPLLPDIGCVPRIWNGLAIPEALGEPPTNCTIAGGSE